MIRIEETDLSYGCVRLALVVPSSFSRSYPSKTYKYGKTRPVRGA